MAANASTITRRMLMTRSRIGGMSSAGCVLERRSRSCFGARAERGALGCARGLGPPVTL